MIEKKHWSKILFYVIAVIVSVVAGLVIAELMYPTETYGLFGFGK